MTLRRALLHEAVGTAALLMIVVGSGIMGERLAAGNTAIALLANSITTGLGLFCLIATLGSTFGSTSGVHLNPVVSLIALIERKLSAKEFVAFIAVQFMAAIVGVYMTHIMFDQSILQISNHHRAGLGQWVSEIIATAGLIAVIKCSCDRVNTLVAVIVAAYIAAAYWFTASTSFANPAVTLARSFTATFSGIAPSDVLAFIFAQIVGSLAGRQIAVLLRH